MFALAAPSTEESSHDPFYQAAPVSAPPRTLAECEKQLETRKNRAVVGYALFAETYPARQCEWMLSTILLLIGVIYALATADYQTPLYDSASLMLPRWVWAVAGMGIGLVRIAFLTINGFYRRSPHWRAVGAGLACMAWLQMSIAALSSPIAGATIAIWPVFFWFDFKAALNAAGEARVSDDRARLGGGGANERRGS